MSIRSEERPRLLVSVRSVEEAVSAVEGGCDLVDVKEPARGSLGAATPEVIEAIGAAMVRLERRVPLSAALGELSEWQDCRSAPVIAPPVTLVKLGLSGCGVTADWPRRWHAARSAFDAAAGRPLGWIAVLYADAAAEGPAPEPLIALAASTGCRGLLVDTFRKDGSRLFDHVWPRELEVWRNTAADADLAFAVAGSLREEDLPRLVAVRPDIVAVRGAVCRDRSRTSEISGDEVRRFRSALSAAFSDRATAHP